MNWNSIKRYDISLTTHCQASCPMCVRTDAHTLKKIDSLKLMHFPLDTYARLLNSLLKKNVKVVKFCGDYGDPLMHPEIEEFIKISTENSLHVDIHTNGGIRNPQWFRRIAELYGSNIKMVFGIDGVDAETSSKYRIGVDFERAFENMITYKQNTKGSVVWDFLLFNFNKDQMSAAHTIAQKYNIELVFKINTREYQDFKIDDTEHKKIKKYIKKYQYIV